MQQALGKFIGNFTSFQSREGKTQFPHCYIPTASQHAPPLARTEKPVVVMSPAPTQLLLSQVHTTLTNDLNEIGNVVSVSALPYPHCYIPTANQKPLPSDIKEKPVLLKFETHAQCLSLQLHITLLNELNAMGNVA